VAPASVRDAEVSDEALEFAPGRGKTGAEAIAARGAQLCHGQLVILAAVGHGFTVLLYINLNLLVRG
jgi:hypothetical protein